MWRTGMIAALVMCASTARAEPDEDARRAPEGPPLTGRRVAGELLLGVAGATAGALVGGALGAGYCEARASGGCVGPVLVGAYVGAALVLPLGVYVVGTMGDHDGSLAATVVGGALGGALGLGLLAVDDDVGILTMVTLAAGPPLGALIGFNSTRRWDRAASTPGTALLSVDDGQLALGIPLVTRGTSTTGAPITTLSLASGTF